MQEDKAVLSNSVQSLVECLEITMMQHPLLALRNMAFWSLDALLNALQVVHSLTAHERPLLPSQWIDTIQDQWHMITSAAGSLINTCPVGHTC